MSATVAKNRFYDSLKGRVVEWLGSRLGGRLGDVAEFAFLLPDIAVLLGRLVLDERAPRRLRIKLGLILGYVATPLDLIPESVFGPVGLVEDVVLAAFALTRVFDEVEDRVIREHWSGRDRHLETLRELAEIVDGVFKGRLGDKLSTWYARDEVFEQQTLGGRARMELINEEEAPGPDEVERLRTSGL